MTIWGWVAVGVLFILLLRILWALRRIEGHLAHIQGSAWGLRRKLAATEDEMERDARREELRDYKKWES